MTAQPLPLVHRDHRRTYEDNVYVYPVVSRRSRGVSIGINLNPDKVCNFDCVYCQVDRSAPGPRKDVDRDLLRAEGLEERVGYFGRRISVDDVLASSGDAPRS